ncbi:MAG TPA: histidinol-phosphate transaminase [Balneolaceae bacterium]|nr:histidinol-phosphate transaminase [Balneolaceae bacterium]
MLNKKIVPVNIEELKPYVAGKTIEEVVKEYKPERISKLASNENRLGYSNAVNDAVNRALSVVNNYPDPQSLALRAAIADTLKIESDQIVVASGSESLISMLCRTFFQDGDEIITADATFIGMLIQAKIQNIEVSKIPLTHDYRFDVRALVDAISPKTRMLYIANPNNPTGTFITQQEFDWMMENVPEDVLVVMDEAYYEFAYQLADFPDALNSGYDNLIILRTFSKGYGLAGFRIGYAIAEKKLIVYLHKTKLTFEPGALAQAAALAAWHDTEFLTKTVDLCDKASAKLYRYFEDRSVKYVRSATNFVMIVFDNEEEASHFTTEMLKRGVILRWLRAFGLADCVRVTFGTDEEMDHFISSMDEVKNWIKK